MTVANYNRDNDDIRQAFTTIDMLTHAPDAEVVSSLGEAVVGQEGLRARFLILLGIFDSRGLAHDEGARNAEHYLVRMFGQSERSAQEYRRAARKLREWKIIAAHYLAGRFSYSAMRLIMRYASPDNEYQLSEMATIMTVVELEQALKAFERTDGGGRGRKREYMKLWDCPTTGYTKASISLNPERGAWLKAALKLGELMMLRATTNVEIPADLDQEGILAFIERELELAKQDPDVECGDEELEEVEYQPTNLADTRRTHHQTQQAQGAGGTQPAQEATDSTDDDAAVPAEVPGDTDKTDTTDTTSRDAADSGTTTGSEPTSTSAEHGDVTAPADGAAGGTAADVAAAGDPDAAVGEAAGAADASTSDGDGSQEVAMKKLAKTRFGPPQHMLLLASLMTVVRSMLLNPRSAVRAPGAEVHIIVGVDGQARLAGTAPGTTNDLLHGIVNGALHANFQLDDGVTIEVGSTQRHIPKRLETAVLATWGFMCAIPGCSHTRFLEMHHIVPYAEGGPTEVRNLMCLCSGCHAMVTNGLITIFIDPKDPRIIHFIVPDGTNFVSYSRTMPVAATQNTDADAGVIDGEVIDGEVIDTDSFDD